MKIVLCSENSSEAVAYPTGNLVQVLMKNRSGMPDGEKNIRKITEPVTANEVQKALKE